jgi:hypothetical protein
MFSIKTHLSTLGVALALAAAITSPVLAGSRSVSMQQASDASAPAVQLARGVIGERQADVYAPTGETVDLTLPVVASRLCD